MNTVAKSFRPRVPITANYIVECCKAYEQEATLEQAEQWLSTNKAAIESAMRFYVEEHIQDIIGGMFVGSFVDPDLERQFREVSCAIYSATEDHEEKHGDEYSESSFNVSQMTQALKHLLRGPGEARICLEHETEFTGATNESAPPQRFDRVHLLRDPQGEMVAELVEAPCTHTDYLVIGGGETDSDS